MSEKNKLHIHTIQLNIGRLLSGTMHMDATEFGAYLSLIVCAYQTKNKLPDCDKRLSRMSRCTMKTWKRVKPTVAEKFLIKDGFWTHMGVRRELDKYASLSSKNRANRLKGLNKDQPVVNSSSDQTATNINNQYPIINNNNPPISPLGDGMGFGLNSPEEFYIQNYMDDSATQAAMKNAPDWDIHYLMQFYNRRIHQGEAAIPNNPPGAFINWCKQFTKGLPPK